MRGFHAVQSAERAANWQSVGGTDHGAGPLKLGQIIRPHAERKIVYELIPNLDVLFKGVQVTTNASGFRGPDHPHQRAPRSMRIVGIGDSVMFGWGVPYAESFLNILGLHLAESLPDTAIQIINTAVPGYNTVMEIETLKAKGLAYKPDLVIIDYVSNDLRPPNFIPHDVDYWTLSRCFLLETLVAAGTRKAAAPYRPFGRIPQLGSAREFSVTLEFDPAKVPAGLKDMVGLQSFKTAMRELAELGREHGFQVIVSTHQRAPEHLREICLELAFPLVETDPRLRRFMQDEGIDNHRGSVLTLSVEDTHPSPLAHRFQAEELFRQLSAGAGLRTLFEQPDVFSGKPAD